MATISITPYEFLWIDDPRIAFSNIYGKVFLFTIFGPTKFTIFGPTNLISFPSKHLLYLLLLPLKTKTRSTLWNNITLFFLQFWHYSRDHCKWSPASPAPFPSKRPGIDFCQDFETILLCGRQRALHSNTHLSNWEHCKWSMLLLSFCDDRLQKLSVLLPAHFEYKPPVERVCINCADYTL